MVGNWEWVGLFAETSDVERPSFDRGVERVWSKGKTQTYAG